MKNKGSSFTYFTNAVASKGMIMIQIDAHVLLTVIYDIGKMEKELIETQNWKA